MLIKNIVLLSLIYKNLIINYKGAIVHLEYNLVQLVIAYSATAKLHFILMFIASVNT